VWAWNKVLLPTLPRRESANTGANHVRLGRDVSADRADRGAIGIRRHRRHFVRHRQSHLYHRADLAAAVDHRRGGAPAALTRARLTKIRAAAPANHAARARGLAPGRRWNLCAAFSKV